MAERQRLHGIVEREVIAVHDFIAAWFRGEVANDQAQFDNGLANRLAPEFWNIQPSGALLFAGDLLEPIRRAHGRNPDFRIRISRVDVRSYDPRARLIVATYVEHQTGARNTEPADNQRISSVLFKIEPGNGQLTWLHIHETAL